MIIRWSDESQETIRDIYGHLYDKSPILADKWSEEVGQKVDLLVRFPEMGRIVPEFNITFIREVFIRTYRLVYTYQNDLITIVTLRPMNRPLGRI